MPEAVPSVSSWDQSARDHRMWACALTMGPELGLVYSHLSLPIHLENVNIFFSI